MTARGAEPAPRHTPAYGALPLLTAFYYIARNVYCVSRPHFIIRHNKAVNGRPRSSLYFLLSQLCARDYRCTFGFQAAVWQPRHARPAGTSAMDLLNVLLDLADAVSAGVAVAAFWHTWVAPPARRALPPPRCASEPDEVEQFVRAAALIKPSGERRS